MGQCDRRANLLLLPLVSLANRKRQTRKFFALPEHVKVKAMGSENSRYRGFVCQGAETAIKVDGYVNGQNKATVVRPDIKVSSAVHIRGREAQIRCSCR